MFEIGFWELLLIAVIALLVIGPERLPKVAYEAGKWFGKLQRFVRNARYELEREFHNYEIQQTLKEQKKQLEDIAGRASDAVRRSVKDVQEAGEDAADDAREGGKETAQPESSQPKDEPDKHE